MLGIPFLHSDCVELHTEGQCSFIILVLRSKIIPDILDKKYKMYFSTKDRFCNIFDFN